MAGNKIRTLPEFNPTDPNTGAQEWQRYKRIFLIHLDAQGLDEKPGKRKVGMLLANMGHEAVKIYDSFTWAEAIEANADQNIEARAAEDKHDLETVFRKFDRHFGVHNYRNIKRQEFLNTKRGKSTIMDYISELKRKAEFCEYGEQKEGLICDMIINGVNDRKCSEKLMEIPAGELTLDRVIQTCRQVELTTAHLKSLDAESPQVNFVSNYRGGPRGNRGSPRRARGRSTYRGQNPYCNRCCKHHAYRNCPAYNQYCEACNEIGHFKVSSLCRAKRRAPRGAVRGTFRSMRRRGQNHFYNSRSTGTGVHFLEEESLPAPPENGMAEMFEQCTLKDVFTTEIDEPQENSDWKVTFEVQGEQLLLEMDTGARCNVLARNTAEKFAHIANIEESPVIINGISGNQMKAYGQISLPCNYRGKEEIICFQVIDTQRPINLLGRSDCMRFDLIARINTVENVTQQIKSNYADVIGNEIGILPGEYEIKIDETVEPVIHAPRTVPVAIRDQVKKELDHLVKCGILSPVTEPTSWVNSMVCIRKKNGRVRICIDPNDLNKAILREHFPMNSIEDIVTRLHGSKYFSTLDANMGYYQIKLTEKSSMLTTFNTPFGRYRYLRMPMGVKCSGEIFQREMVTNFGSMEGVEIVIDDILVHGKTLEEHTSRLKKVLDKARKIGLKLNEAKCVLVKSEVDYVGHRLTGEGLKPTKDRVKAILEMKEPENRSELETVLGMLAYVGKFIPCLSQLNAPLRELKTKEEWHWGPNEKQAFDNVKKALTSTEVLKYFDAKRPVTVTVDASTKGLGAAIIQENGVVAYASRALTSAEQRYAQIEKEMLAVVFGCERFHKLLYGKSDVTVESDHKPLETIMKKPIHTAPMRIQKMILKLQPYELKLVYVKGKELGLADCLSRLPLPETNENIIDDEMMVLAIETLSGNNYAEIVEATRKDEELQILIKVICHGWPEKRSDLPIEVIPYWDFRDELSTYNGIVYRGERTVIPSEMRPATLKTIHSSHFGMLKCKQRARELVFWPGMNKQIEDMVSKCSACLTHRNKPQKEPMIIQPIPPLPWSKVGTDLFEINGLHYLILVDYYSNFIEVAPLKSDTRSSTVIRHIKENIARYGIMDTLVSDNGPQYTSAEFSEFTSTYGISHITSSPLHQQTNGLAERAVQTVKNMINKCLETGDDIYLSLLDHRNTPRDNDTGSPSQRLMGRRAKTRLPITTKLRQPSYIAPETVTSRLMDDRLKQKEYYDRNTKEREAIKLGDAVRIQTPEGWKPVEFIGPAHYPRSYIVKAGDSGREYRRNSSMLMKTREDPITVRPNDQPGSMVPIFVPNENYGTSQAMRAPPGNAPPPESTRAPIQKESKPPDKQPTHNPSTHSRSGRPLRKPSYLSDYTK